MFIQPNATVSSMQIKGKPHNVHNNYHMTEPLVEMSPVETSLISFLLICAAKSEL